MVILISQKLGEISDLTIPAEEKTWHKLRIKLKRIQYWLEFLVKTLKAGSPYLAVHQTLKNITENLGQWHDRVVLVHQMDKQREGTEGVQSRSTKNAPNQQANTQANGLKEQIGLLVVALKAEVHHFEQGAKSYV
jgi:CHAD domain-containing protein